jgi:hypothetical protein
VSLDLGLNCDIQGSESDTIADTSLLKLHSYSAIPDLQNEGETIYAVDCV